MGYGKVTRVPEAGVHDSPPTLVPGPANRSGLWVALWRQGVAVEQRGAVGFELDVVEPGRRPELWIDTFQDRVLRTFNLAHAGCGAVTVVTHPGRA